MKPWQFKPVEPRLSARLDRNGAVPEHRPDLGPCWLWTGGTNDHGYGTMSVEGRNAYVHRVSYELFVGPIPDGLELDHLCRVPACANPDHLEPVTHRENSLRSESLMAAQAQQTSCVRGHSLMSDGDVYIRKDNGARQCKECRRIRRRAGAK